jgi:hypothetical protein
MKRKPINLRRIAQNNSGAFHKYKISIRVVGNIIFTANALDANTIISNFYDDYPDLKFYILKHGKYVEAKYSNR